MFAMILNIFYLYFRPEKVISITCILEIGCSISLITGLFLQNHCLMMPMLFNYVSQFLFNIYLVTTEIIRSTNKSGTLNPALDLRTQLIRALNKPELKYSAFKNVGPTVEIWSFLRFLEWNFWPKIDFSKLARFMGKFWKIRKFQSKNLKNDQISAPD